MIKKIKEIKNVAVFKDFEWNSNIPDFKRFNAFYGWNGCGKTTITRILSAFEKGGLDKLELGDDAKCVIETDNNTFELRKNQSITDLLKNKIRVFNEDFIEQNLDWETGKASKILMIGKEQIEQKKELGNIIKDLNDRKGQLDTKNKEKEKEAKEKNNILEKARDEIKKDLRDIKNVTPKSNRATDYINYTVIDVENILKGKEFLSLKEEEILQLKNSLKESEQKEIINEINIDLGWVNKILEKSQEIFKKVIPEEGLRLLFNSGQIDERLKEWLRIGYEIHKDKQHPVECEFCKNKISEERLRELGEYFSDVLRSLLNDIDQIIKECSSDKLPKLPLQKEKFYSELQNNFSDLSNNFSKQLDIIRDEINKIKNALTEKKNNPSQKITFDFDVLNKVPIELNKIIEQISNLIKANNDKTKSFKEKRTESAHKLEVAIISKYKSDYDTKKTALDEIRKEIEKLNQEKEKLENQQKELEQKLKEHYLGAEEFNKLLWSFLGRR